MNPAGRCRYFRDNVPREKIFLNWLWSGKTSRHLRPPECDGNTANRSCLSASLANPVLTLFREEVLSVTSGLQQAPERTDRGGLQLSCSRFCAQPQPS
ncbi:hypothetical protein INR49_029565 [Caranx melampygus]|nr:hypothetical protein INR49_029565 [Caranx melampygus]